MRFMNELPWALIRTLCRIELGVVFCDLGVIWSFVVLQHVIKLESRCISDRTWSFWHVSLTLNGLSLRRCLMIIGGNLHLGCLWPIYLLRWLWLGVIRSSLIELVHAELSPCNSILFVKRLRVSWCCSNSSLNLGISQLSWLEARFLFYLVFISHILVWVLIFKIKVTVLVVIWELLCRDLRKILHFDFTNMLISSSTFHHRAEIHFISEHRSFLCILGLFCFLLPETSIISILQPRKVMFISNHLILREAWWSLRQVMATNFLGILSLLGSFMFARKRSNMVLWGFHFLMSSLNVCLTICL